MLNKDEIIRMAREAGWDEHNATYDTRIERFAALVAAHAKQEYIDSVYEQHRETMFSNKDLGMLVDAVKAEREACAQVCERLISGDGICADDGVWIHDCAAAIRNRGEK